MTVFDELKQAIRLGEQENVEALLHRLPVFQIDAEDGALLTYAATWGHVDIARALVRHGADPNVAKGLPLARAINGCDLMMAVELVGAGADPFLHRALVRDLDVSENHMPVVGFLETVMQARQDHLRDMLATTRFPAAMLRARYLESDGMLCTENGWQRAAAMGMALDAAAAVKKNGDHLLPGDLDRAADRLVARKELAALFDPALWRNVHELKRGILHLTEAQRKHTGHDLNVLNAAITAERQKTLHRQAPRFRPKI